MTSSDAAGSVRSLVSVLPVSQSGLSFQRVSSPSAAADSIATDILLQLRNETSPERQRQLLHSLAPLIGKPSMQVTQLLQSTDEWVRVAAAAVVARNTRCASELRIASAQLSVALRHYGPGDMVARSIAGDDIEYSAQALLFMHFDFLGNPGTESGVSCLPLNRIVARDCRDELYRWIFGALQLCRYGENSDAILIRPFLASDDRERRRIAANALNQTPACLPSGMMAKSKRCRRKIWRIYRVEKRRSN